MPYCDPYTSFFKYHWTLLISSLHWLPVKYRIQFKINLPTYKVYKTDCPVYLKDCVQPYSSAYNNRRSEPAQHMLNVLYYDYKHHKSFTHLSNSFFYSAPRLWNSLPQTCRCAPSLSAFRSRFQEGISMDKGISSLDLFFPYQFFLPVPDYFSFQRQWGRLSLMMCVQNALLRRLGTTET